MAPPKKHRKHTFFTGRRIWQQRWRKCVEDFLRDAADSSIETARVYESTLRRFFADPLKSPESYTSEDVRAFLHQRPLVPASRNAQLGNLSSFYKFASRYKIVLGGKIRPILPPGADPTDGVELSRVVLKAPKYWTPEQLGKIFASLPRHTDIGMRDRALLLTYFWTVRRRAEIQRLKWGDLEPGHRFQDGHVGVLYRWSGKGKTGEAELPRPAWVAIVEYLQFVGRWETMKPEDPVFVSLTGRELTVNRITDRIRSLVKAAGLTGSTHTFRHSGIRIRYQEGADLMKLKALCGHESLETTYRYVLLISDGADEQARQMEEKYQY